MVPRMSRPGNRYDKARGKGFMKTFKREEIYANTYRDLDHLRANIAAFIEQYYNRVRLHSALGYRSRRVRARSEFGDPCDRSHHAVFQTASTRSSGIISEGSGCSNRGGVRSNMH